MALGKAAGVVVHHPHNVRAIDLFSQQINREATLSTSDFQAAFVAARFRLDADRARLVAEIAWGGAR